MQRFLWVSRIPTTQLYFFFNSTNILLTTTSSLLFLFSIFLSGSLQDMVLEGQNAVGCRLEIFWNDGQSRKSDLDLQPYLIFAKLTTKETTATRETKSVERHELFQENRIKKGSWYSGVVDLYNPKTKKYHFTYDDKGKYTITTASNKKGTYV